MSATAAPPPLRGGNHRLRARLPSWGARPEAAEGSRLSAITDGAQRLLGSAAAMLLCMTAYGILQERVVSRPFGFDSTHGTESAEFFDYSTVLVLANRLLTCAVAAAISAATGGGTPPPPLHALLAPCMVVAATNGAATFCQYEALRFVSFAGVTLAKSAKMLPVLLWGTLVLRKRYRRVDYLAAVGIAVGCAVFATSGMGIATRLPAGDAGAANAGGALPLRTGLAAALLVAYLAFDGLTSTYQEHLFRTHATLTAATLVAYVSAVASVMSLIAALGSGQLPAAARFAAVHPEVGFYVAALSVAAAGASLLINDTIRRFGALAFAGIMTSRQLISVLASAVAFRHPLSAAQWASAALVFVSLYGRLLLETQATTGAKTMRGALLLEDEPVALDESPTGGAHAPSAV